MNAGKFKKKNLQKKRGRGNEWRNVKQFILKIFILTATKQIKSGKIEQENKKKE